MSRQTGSAISETLVGLLALFPAFLAMDHLGRIQDMARSADAGARYQVWETLAGSRTTRERRLTLEDRILGSDRAGIVSPGTLARRGVTRNPLWQSVAGPLRQGVGQRADPGGADLPAPGRAVRTIARGDAVPAWMSVGGLSGTMLGLDRARPVVETVHVDANPWPRAASRRRTLRFESTGSLSIRTWQADDDRDYQRRTQRIVASEPVDRLATPAQTLGRFSIFREGRYARSTDFVPPSRRFPDRR